jgi:hypothetical protein
VSSSVLGNCERLLKIKHQFEENETIVEAISARNNAEALFIAIAMAIAYLEGAITLNTTGENHIKASIEELDRILEEIDEGDE